MSLCHDGASPSGPDGIRDDSPVSWALAWTVSSVLASVLMMALTSRTTPLNACLDKRGAAVDSSTLGSMTSTLGETPIFVLRMASSSRCAHHLLYHTERTPAGDGSGVDRISLRAALVRVIATWGLPGVADWVKGGETLGIDDPRVRCLHNLADPTRPIGWRRSSAAGGSPAHDVLSLSDISTLS